MRRFLAFCLLICLALTGCAHSGQEAYVPTGNGLTWDEDYTGPVATIPKEENYQELVLTFYPNVTMNPIACTDFTNRALFSLIYQGLFSVDRSYNVQPVLCKRYKVSDDMRSYTFYLENATFSDGSYLTAEDVIASLQAARSSSYYGGRFGQINDILLSEDGGITINLNTPYENLPLLLDIPIIAADELESDRPLGTGPYTFQGGSLGGALKKRETWWCKATLPVDQDSIRLICAESITQIRDSFEFSDLNLVCADPSSDRYVDYRCDYELWDCESGVFLYLACSVDSPVFSIPEIRQALTYAIDRDTLVDDHYHGFARSASLPASPLSPYYSQSLAGKYEYDPIKFVQAVQKAGMTNAEVTLMVNKDDSLRLRVARDIAKMLEDAGLRVAIKEANTEYYKNSLQVRTFDLYLGQTKLSPNMDLSPFFHTTGSLSYGGVNNSEIYQLCQQSLENHGNFYTLHKTIMDTGALCPVLSCSYAVYANRGLLSSLSPARDNIFYYSLGKTMDKALVQ